MKTHLIPATFFACLATLTLSTQAQSPRAWLVDSNLDQLFRVDLVTGAATLVGSTLNNGLDTPAGLSWRADTQTLWTIDLSGGEVGTIDTTNGTFSQQFIANPTSGWQGMEWDPASGRFYLLNQNLNIYTLDPTTGVTTLLGASGVPLMTALEVSPNGTLYGIGFSTGILYTINKTTGAALAGPTVAPTQFQGLSFDSNGILYGSNTGTDSLYRIDPVTGASTLIGAHGGGVQFAKGFDIENGCTGQFIISGTGCPDASSTVITMRRSGLPCVAQNVAIGTNVGAGTLNSVLVLGTSTSRWGSLLLPFSLTPFGNTGCTIYTSQTVVLGLLQNQANFPLTIPNDPTLSGLRVFFQGMVIDARLPGLGIATSDLLEMTVGI